MNKQLIKKQEEQKSLKQQFIDLCLNITASYNNDENVIDLLPYENAFYLFMSQFFKKHKVQFGTELKDLRYSYFEIQDSRTGKGQRIKVIKKLCSALEKYNYGIKWTKETSFTTAGLIGTIDSDAVKYNMKNKLTSSSEDYQDPVVYGDLFNFDIIFFEEAKSLLVPGKYTENLLNVLQEALDTPNPGNPNIRKKLASKYDISYNSTCSIYATTYYLQEINPVLFEQGFFQRIGIYYKILTNTETMRLRNNIIDMYQGEKDFKEFDYKIELFCERIMKLNVQDVIILKVEEDSIQYLKNMIKQYNNVLEETQGVQNTIMKSLSQTIIDIAVKFGAINALIHGKTKISLKEIKSGYRVIRGTVNTIYTKLDPDTMLDKKIIHRVTNCYLYMEKDKKEIMKTSLAEDYAHKTGIGINKARNIIDNCISLNIFRMKKGERNKKLLELV